MSDRPFFALKATMPHFNYIGPFLKKAYFSKWALLLEKAAINSYANLSTQMAGASMWNLRVITSDAIPIFLQRGGKLDYRPIHTPKGWNWELWAITPEEMETQVISSKTGEPRIFKSADALLSFHMRLFPNENGLFIPAPKHTATK